VITIGLSFVSSGWWGGEKNKEKKEKDRERGLLGFQRNRPPL
jgi:hypothetical protein